ncbi:MAG: helix-turn-helix domain-containing protein [Thermodesulfobacteriota bacterium]
MKEDKIPATTPGFLVRIETEELEELAQYIKHADIELMQLGRSEFPSSLTQVFLENINLQVGHFGAGHLANATTDKVRSGMVFKITGDFPTICNGYDIDGKSFMFYRKNSDYMATTNGSCKWTYITFKPNHFEESILDPLNVKLDTRKSVSAYLRCQEYASLDLFYDIVNEITELVNSNPAIFQNPDVIKGMEWSLINSQILILSNTLNTASKRRRGKKTHEHIIKLSIDFLKANSYKPIHLLDLCSALSISMRTLYYAFQEFFGISPIRYLRLVRYARARRDLLIADPEDTTVTDIAAKWHFWHFGRFSVEYKSLYGESPSETLNKTRY